MIPVVVSKTILTVFVNVMESLMTKSIDVHMGKETIKMIFVMEILVAHVWNL